MLILSLFPGIGLLDMAFEEEGFTVVRGPDLLWGGDIHRFHPPPGKFDGVIGGPPCQRWSRLRHIVEHNGYELAPDLIPEYERIVAEAAPAWFLMENVPAAPMPVVAGYHVQDQLVDSHRDCGSEQGRVRRFSFGRRGTATLPFALDWWAPPVTIERKTAVLASGGLRATPVAIGGSGKPKRRKSAALSNLGYSDARSLAESCRLQGLPADFLADAPFTVAGKLRAVNNGVPLPMGRAVARAVKRALGLSIGDEAAA